MRLWVTLPPERGEEVLCVKTGSVNIPGTPLALIGGLLVLTNQRLYQGPLDTRLAGKLLSVMGKVTGPTGTDTAIDLIVGWANKARAVALQDIASVDSVGRSSLVVTTENGKRRTFGVAASARTPVWSPNNVPHRDEMLAAIRQAISRV
ncbi:hypothetical protein ABID95_004409 [Streptomyces atratus]